MKRRSFLMAGAALIPGGMFAGEGSRLVVPDAESKPKSLVIVLLAGGLSHIDSFDPKPDAPGQIRSEFGTLATRATGVRFTALLPKLAECANRFTLLRAVSHGVGVHDPAQKMMLCGSSNSRPSTPSLGAIVSQQMQSAADIPTYAAIPALSSNAGEFGQLHEPFNVLGDSGILLTQAPSESEPDRWSEFSRRRRLLNVLQSNSPISSGTEATAEHAKAYRRAVSVMQASELRTLTNLDGESPQVRSLYGTGLLSDHLIYARRLLELGTRCITVLHGGWDTHYDGFSTLKQLLPPLDHALAGFLSDLSNRGMLESTMVAVLTEFGRTPTITNRGGRDHWPRCGNALLAGGRFHGGLTWGATDAHGAEVVEDPCSPQDIGFTLLEEMGIKPRETFVPPTGRVLLPEGRFLQEIIG
ncbi:MAG TPA: DUF1501 domain-containing protein [Pirellulaceae bacterium]|nr:DUF1501 domain-containing protein [Pirellulaceae bacterium]